MAETDEIGTRLTKNRTDLAELEREMPQLKQSGLYIALQKEVTGLRQSIEKDEELLKGLKNG